LKIGFLLAKVGKMWLKCVQACSFAAEGGWGTHMHFHHLISEGETMFFEEPHESWQTGASYNLLDYLFLLVIWPLLFFQWLERTVKKIHQFEEEQRF
jgi:hypothetical protein